MLIIGSTDLAFLEPIFERWDVLKLPLLNSLCSIFDEGTLLLPFLWNSEPRGVHLKEFLFGQVSELIDGHVKRCRARLVELVMLLNFVQILFKNAVSMLELLLGCSHFVMFDHKLQILLGGLCTHVPVLMAL